MCAVYGETMFKWRKKKKKKGSKQESKKQFMEWKHIDFWVKKKFWGAAVSKEGDANSVLGFITTDFHEKVLVIWWMIFELISK